MAGNDDEFPKLMASVLAGSEQAAAVLLDRYGPAIRYAVRRKLDPRLRSKFDSQDFVQEVWLSFFANPPVGGMDEPKNLVRLLTQMARNKLIDVSRQRLDGEKYNVNREHSLESSAVDAEEDLTANQPTPSEVVTGREEWDRLLEGQPLVYRRILVLVREGKRPAEIAAEMGLTERSVYRIISSIVLRLKPC